MKSQLWTQAQWSQARRQTYRRPGDFWNAVGLHPTPDRQQLRRANGWSSFTTWNSDFTKCQAGYYNGANSLSNPTYHFIGYDTSETQLAVIAYTGGGFNTNVSYSTTYDLNISDTRLRGLHMRNFLLWYSQDLVYIAHTDEDVYKSANFGAGAEIYDGGANPDARMLTLHGSYAYLICETGEIYRSDDSCAAFASLFDPAPFLNFRYCVPMGHYLVLFAVMEDGSMQIYRLPLSNPTDLLPVAHVPGIPGAHPIQTSAPAQEMPFAYDGQHVYFLSGHLPEFDEGRLDVYRFDGSRALKVAEIDDAADPTNYVYAIGLTLWRGELLFYEVGPAITRIRMLVGDRFIDVHDLSSTDPWDTQTSGYSAVYNLAGTLFLVGRNDSLAEGFIHAKGYGDGTVESSWIDMDHPGMVKRLNRLSAHLSDANATTSLTLSYRADDESAWTQAATQTAASYDLVAGDVGKEFYRIQFKVALSDTSATADIRLDAVEAHYTVES